MPAYTISLPAAPARASRFATLLGAIDRDVVAMIAVRFAIVAAAGISSVVTARYLTPSQRGQYFLVYTLAQTLAQFGNVGLHSSNTFLVARDRSLAGALLANSLWVSLAAGTLGTALVFAVLRATGGALAGDGIWFVAALAPATLFYLLGVNLLVGLKRIASYNTFQLASNYVVLLCLIVAALLGAGPAGFLAACATGWILVSGCLAITLGRGTAGTLAFRPDVFREGFRFALKAYVATLCGFLIARGNVFLLSGLTSSAQVGYYSVASQISDVMGILPQSMALVLFPALVTATSGRFRTTMRHMAVVGALMAIGCFAVALLAEPFVRAVFGERFLPTVPMLRWMLPGVFFVGLTAIPSQYLAASGFPVSVVGVWIAGSAIALLLGRLLIPVMSGVGAAMALSVTHGAVFAAILSLSLIHARRHSAALADPQTVPVEGVFP